jgi:hypothetical protein
MQVYGLVAVILHLILAMLNSLQRGVRVWAFFFIFVCLMQPYSFSGCTIYNATKQTRTKLQRHQKQAHCQVNRLSQPPLLTPELITPLLLGRCSVHLRRSCAYANTVYSQAERMFIVVHLLEHNFASKSFAAFRETFSYALHDKEVPNSPWLRFLTSFIFGKKDSSPTTCICIHLSCYRAPDT